MEISITKKKDKDPVISCMRKDGSVTWMRADSFFVMHDLCHYAVESILEIKKGFYGMLAAGIDINDFALPKDQRNFELTDEALLAEHLVNLLVIEHNQGRLDDFMGTLRSSYSINDGILTARAVEEQKINEIRIKYGQLLQQWKSLPIPGSLLLEFKE